MTEHPQSPSPETILAHEPFIRALARRLVGDPGGADDVTQETLIAAWRGGPVERLRSWMATAARNNVRMAWRSESSRRRREESVSRSEPSVPSPEEISEREAIRRMVVEALLALEPLHRDVLVLRYWEDLAPRSIAERLGLEVEAARTRLRRAHERLRAELARREGPDWRLALAPLLSLIHI